MIFKQLKARFCLDEFRFRSLTFVMLMLSFLAAGLQDYEAALKIEPNNEQVKADADRLRDHIQTSSDYT